MFDTFAGGRDGSTSTARFVEGDHVGSAGSSPFGDVASYATCGCCGSFHAMQDGTGGQGIIVNTEDRGGFGPNGKPSLSPVDAGAQITRSNQRWGDGPMGTAATVTFAFRVNAATMPTDTQGFSQFTAQQIAVTLQALAAWSDVANITFTRSLGVGDSQYSNNATILFGNYSSGQNGAAAFAYLPTSAATSSVSGDVWVNSSQPSNSNPVFQNYGQLTLIHEIGHAIGLSHPAAYNASEGVNINYNEHATYFEDSLQFTVMSYFDETWTGAQFGAGNSRYPATVLLDDIAAAQRLYGANMTTRTGDTVYGFNSTAGQAWYNATSATSALIFAVWDAGGTDTFDFSGYSQNQVIDLRQGNFSSVGGLTGNIAVAMGAVIENVVGGSGADTIYGNSANNRITGGLGNDIINGGLGSDTVVFSGNQSAYTITWNGQTATVVGPDGTDTITNVEFLAFADGTIAAAPPPGGLIVYGDNIDETINGSGLADVIAGLAGADTINGLAGNDILNGGAGNDILNGGDHNDVLIGGIGDDTLNGGDGADVADYGTAGSGVIVNLAAGTATGGAGSDFLTGIEEVRGSTFNDNLTGDANANILRGGGGIDVLNGAGGSDTLYAGAPGVTGGAADVVKAAGTVNSTRATAVAISSTTAFDLLPTTAIANSSTIPHATVRATSSGTTEWYAVTMTAGGTLTLDIDEANFDSCLVVYNSDGVEIARNDDSVSDPGSNFEAGMSVNVGFAGVYYVQVSRFSTNVGSDFTFQNLEANATYTLHISTASATPVALIATGSTLNGDAGNDTLFGGTGIDTLNGGADNDVLIGAGGNDLLNGGDGYDIAGYSGVRRAYTASVTSVSGGLEGGTDTLTGIEDLSFSDGRLTFARDSQAAQVMRLYDTAFDRAPDQSGFEASLDVIENGSFTLQSLANEFVNSVEFQTRFGALTNQQFVEQLYVFALNRNGDTVGVATWVAALEAGMTRAEVLVNFSESPEHRDITQPQLDQGLWVADEQSLQIARLYDATYDRLPDQGGMRTWRDALGGGMSLITIAQAFATSPEFQSTYGSLSNQAFVELLYQLCLDRAGEPDGIATWVSALNGGMSRGEVLFYFSESPEHVALTRDTYLGGVPTTDLPAGAVAHDDENGAQVLPATADHGADVHVKDGHHDDAQVLPAAVDTGSAAKGGAVAQVLPAVADSGVDAKGDDAQVLPGIADAGADQGKGEIAQVLPAESHTGDEALVLPGLIDDGFLLDGKAADFGAQVLPGAPDAGLVDLGDIGDTGGTQWPDLEQLLVSEWHDTGHGAGHGSGHSVDLDPYDLRHLDPWAA